MKCSISTVYRGPWTVVRRNMVRCWVLIGSLFTVHGARLFACPLCKEALTQGMAKGFFWSILLMIAVPAVVVGVIAGALWRAGQKRRGLQAGPRE